MEWARGLNGIHRTSVHCRSKRKSRVGSNGDISKLYSLDAREDFDKSLGVELHTPHIVVRLGSLHLH